jgi:hypothetical protein
MPLAVYLLVGHRRSDNERSEEQVFLKLPMQDQNLINLLSNAYRQMPTPLRLVLLLSIYDEMSDDEIAKMLQCSSRKIKHLLQMAASILDGACGKIVSQENIVLMLESEIDSFEISKEVIERVREMLCENLFGDEQDEFSGSDGAI